MGKIREWLKGKKTYVVCAAAILTAVVAWSQGEYGTVELVATIFAAVTGSTLRAAVPKK